ncbi:DUF4303 domain-containing protein [Pseudomonas alliivorans]|nr:DUF4303 domain-containing protein [Pseudomonas alliivorans]
MDWAALEKRVYESSRAAFQSLKQSHENEKIYAYALYTDSSAMTIAPSANSIEALNHKIEQEEEEDRTEEVIAYYKWASSEWAYEAYGGELFADINNDLRNDVERADFEFFKLQVTDVMTKTLAALVSEHFFEQADTGNVVVFVTVTDDDDAEKIENSSAQVINSKNVYREFITRYHV